MPPTAPREPSGSLGWVARNRILVLAVGGTLAVALIVYGVVGSTGGGETCSQVAQGWVSSMQMPPGQYVYSDAGTTLTGRTAWVVKKDDGAMWATDINPALTPSEGGLVVPLNDQARAESDSGAALPSSQVADLFPGASASSVGGCSTGT
jgi:hypothetical protein